MIGLSILSGSHLELVPEVVRLVRAAGVDAPIVVGGIIVVIGILLLIFWSFWIGLIITLVGLIFFGGFARGRWY